MSPSTADVVRFWSKVDRSGSCWIWTAALYPNGYGLFSADGHNVRAHRFAYQLHVGPIPEGLELDHVAERGCSSRACVNPAHLEPVTHAENIRRGRSFAAVNSAKTHCPSDHPMTQANTWLHPVTGWRKCWTCKVDAQRAWRARRREAVA